MTPHFAAIVNSNWQKSAWTSYRWMCQVCLADRLLLQFHWFLHRTYLLLSDRQYAPPRPSFWSELWLTSDRFQLRTDSFGTPPLLLVSAPEESKTSETCLSLTFWSLFWVGLSQHRSWVLPCCRFCLEGADGTSWATLPWEISRPSLWIQALCLYLALLTQRNWIYRECGWSTLLSLGWFYPLSGQYQPSFVAYWHLSFLSFSGDRLASIRLA